MVHLIAHEGSGGDAATDGSGYGAGYGDGAGYGSGYGDGAGYGYGYGYGDGYGYGYGDGAGYGDGSGDGAGYGAGYGYGYGAGDGSGDGYGAGAGYGSKDETANEAYWASVAAGYAVARTDSAAVAIWRSTADGLPANNGSWCGPARPGLVYETPGPLSLCNPGTLHATFNPEKWRGERLWVVAMHGPVAIGEHKIGSLKREIVAEITR